MLLSTYVVVVVMAVTTTQVEGEAAATSAAESVMERPMESQAVEARGAEGNGGGGTVSARQGMPERRPNILSLTLNALNPVPYLLGGLNGVRQVMSQRFHPHHNSNGRHTPLPNNFRGAGRPPLPPHPPPSPHPSHISGGGKFKMSPGGLRHSGGDGGGGGSGGLRDAGSDSMFTNGGGGMHALSHSSQFPNGGFLRPVRGTRNENSQQSDSFSTFSRPRRPPRPNLPLDSGSNHQNKDFGTLKPQSVISHRPEGPLYSPNFPFQPTSAPKPKSVNTETPNSAALESGKPLSRVINIKVPEEMQDLAVLEISMKTNGDISLSGRHDTGVPLGDPRRPGPVKTPGASVLSSASLLTSFDDIFAEDTRLHELNNDNKFLGPLRREVDLMTAKDSAVLDLLRMQTAEHTNPALLNAFPLDWRSISSLQPIVINNEDIVHDNYQRNVPLTKIFTKNTPVASYSTYAKNPDLNKFYLLPVGIPSPSAANRQSLHNSASSPVRHQSSSMDNKKPAVYYIDITIPGNAGGTPSVNAKRLTRRRRSLDFDGWFPMNVSNPMADDPTVAYQPPPLERVHFSNEPMKEKPLYPVRPENPTVFVVRSEKQKPEYHSVYGTENIEYYHINPQSNIVRAFRSPSFTIGEATLVPEQTESTTVSPITSSTTSTTTDSTAEAVEESSSVPETNLEIPQKEEGFSDRSDVFYEDTELSAGEAALDKKPDCETETESDLEGAFSETRTSLILPPDLFYLLRERSKKSQERTSAQLPQPTSTPPPARRRFDNTATIRTGPALHELLGNLPRESQIEESPYLGSATDSAGVRKIPPPNFRYSSLRTSASGQSPVISRTRVRGSSTRKPALPGRSWYLIDTRSSDSNRRREPSIASYIVPETLSGDNKVLYKQNGPVSYVNKQITTISDLIDNPHLNDHMNSYKPTLTANSLSELLQIFRYTQVTNEPNGSNTEEPVTVREFRYTRPTEETPTTEILPTNYRYTPSPSKFSDPTTEPGITEKPQAVYSDAVADTNSLDGYLFSDSEANPEYARPQVRQNTVVKEDKGADREKGAARGTSKVKINSNLVQRATVTSTPAPRELRVIRPGPAPSSKIATVPPQYVIYQGHSKVKVFGVNSAEDNGWSKFDIRDFILASTPSSSSTTTTPASPSSTSSLPTATTTFAPTSPSPSPLPGTNATLPSTSSSPVEQSTSSSPVEQSTSPPITDTTPSDTTEATLPSGVGEEYEYYYADGDYGVTDLAFGDYQTEDFGQHLIYVSGQVPPPPSVAHLAHPPPLIPIGERQKNPDPSVNDPLEESFPQALSPATALTQAELLDILTKQQPDDSQFSYATWPATEATTDQPMEDSDAESDSGA